MVRQRPSRTAILAAVFRDHLRESVRHGMRGRSEPGWGSPAIGPEVVVCFADLVGFTALGGQLTAEELATVAGRLAKLAAEVVGERVRLVKTIGDAAMFVGPEAPPLVEAALTLVDAVEADELPALRSGIASGTAVQLAGDVYGNAVNLASRVTDVAHAGCVLCTKEVRETAADGFAWSYAGRHRLKGISELLPLYSARRLAAPASARETGPRRPRGSHSPSTATQSARGAERKRRELPASGRAKVTAPTRAERDARVLGAGERQASGSSSSQ